MKEDKKHNVKQYMKQYILNHQRYDKIVKVPNLTENCCTKQNENKQIRSRQHVKNNLEVTDRSPMPLRARYPVRPAC